MSGLDTDRPRLQGPITMTPSTVNNYGLDSCSILVIPSLPPTLIIAETNGKLHHALFLEAENSEDVWRRLLLQRKFEILKIYFLSSLPFYSPLTKLMRI